MQERILTLINSYKKQSLRIRERQIAQEEKGNMSLAMALGGIADTYDLIINDLENIS